MEAIARINPDYARRMAGVGLLMCGLALWSLYDGLFAWPRINRTMAEMAPELVAANLAAESWLLQDMPGSTPLERHFRSHTGGKAPRKLVREVDKLRIPSDPATADSAMAQQRDSLQHLFTTPLYSQEDLQAQFIQACIAFLLGAMAFAAVGRRWRRVFKAADSGLHGSGFGGSYSWEQIEGIDWSRWEQRGIFVVYFKDGTSARCDAWHFKGLSGVVASIAEMRPDLAAPAGL